MSRGFDNDWLLRHQLRTGLAKQRRGPDYGVETPSKDEQYELDLHDKIKAECRRRVWKYVYSDPTRPTTCGEGVCDFIIYADVGKVLNVECKSATGKLSMEQLAFIAWLKKLGHPVHVVRSFREFLEVCSANCST